MIEGGASCAFNTSRPRDRLSSPRASRSIRTKSSSGRLIFVGPIARMGDHRHEAGICRCLRQITTPEIVCRRHVTGRRDEDQCLSLTSTSTSKSPIEKSIDTLSETLTGVAGGRRGAVGSEPINLAS